MFGYRLLRDADYDRLLSDRLALEQEVRRLQTAHHDTVSALHQTLCDRMDLERGVQAKLSDELSAAKAEARSKSTMADLLTTRINVLEQEVALLRNRVTGLPQVVPQIGKGTPIQSAIDGAGADIFEDVGDSRAADLQARGLLHEAEPLVPFPSAAVLTESLSENGNA
jgi:hypothetical protein